MEADYAPATYTSYECEMYPAHRNTDVSLFGPSRMSSLERAGPAADDWSLPSDLHWTLPPPPLHPHFGDGQRLDTEPK